MADIEESDLSLSEVDDGPLKDDDCDFMDDLDDELLAPRKPLIIGANWKRRGKHTYGYIHDMCESYYRPMTDYLEQRASDRFFNHRPPKIASAVERVCNYRYGPESNTTQIPMFGKRVQISDIERSRTKHKSRYYGKTRSYTDSLATSGVCGSISSSKQPWLSPPNRPTIATSRNVNQNYSAEAFGGRYCPRCCSGPERFLNPAV